MSSPTVPPRRSRGGLAPVFTLLLLAPILSEVLSGSTRLSTIFVLIPSTGFWGCAALLIRETVRRRGHRWSLLLLGLALALLEECVVQQTSLAPLIGIDPATAYARWAGVNWVYLLWALGFESVWAVVLPVVLTEALFPDLRHEPWLRRRGIIVAAVVIALAAFVAWFAWTQIFLPKFYPQLHYHVSPVAIGVALAGIIGLVVVAILPQPAAARPSGVAPRPALAALVAFAVSLPWYLLILLAFNALRSLPPAWPLGAGIVVGLMMPVLYQRWSGQTGWSDAHVLAIANAVIAATLIGGAVTLRVAHASVVDRAAQILFCLVALVGLALAARRRGIGVPPV